MTPLVVLVAKARRVGLVINRDGSNLTIRGSRAHEGLAKQILARKTEVLTLVDVYAGRSESLDWSRATVSGQLGRCGLCSREALLRDPYDRQPMHKTCAEAAIRPERRAGLIP